MTYYLRSVQYVQCLAENIVKHVLTIFFFFFFSTVVDSTWTWLFVLKYWDPRNSIIIILRSTDYKPNSSWFASYAVETLRILLSFQSSVTIVQYSHKISLILKLYLNVNYYSNLHTHIELCQVNDTINGTFSR